MEATIFERWLRSRLRRLRLRSFARLGNSIYFAATTPAAGRELWTSDGTAQGTHLVTDLWPGNNGSYPFSMLGYGIKLYFTATSPQVSPGLGRSAAPTDRLTAW